MKDKAPPDRRKFADAAEEIQYLYDKLLHWLYGRQDVYRARPFALRLKRLLAKADPHPESIFSEECWSLVYEAERDYAKAIKHRQDEIRRIRRLHEISVDTPQQKDIFQLYGYDDLSDRLDLLATLYHAAGQLDRALETVQESKQLCKDHGIRFDGADLLRDYLEEKRTAADGRTGNRGPTRRLGRQPARKSG
jgi:tetratricopeptide (TPR) repeat protein